MQKVILKAILLFTFLFSYSQLSFATLPSFDSQGNELPTLSPLVKKVSPSVVNVSTKTTQRLDNPLLNDPFFRDFFDFPRGNIPQERQVQGAGSGVIINADEGVIITNSHVVDKANEVQIILHDGRTLEAELIGSDPEVDIAVLKIDSDHLQQITIANSDQVEAGDFAIAMGNPFGLGHTVTTGVVSAIGRSGLGIQGYENFIQTDASINPGNSGGALLNLKGELIGINTAIIGPSGGNVGIGFAIPTNMAMAVVEQILEYGEVKRGRLGIIIQDITPELRSAFNLPKDTKGVLVSRVEEDSSAEKAGLLVGDVIISVDGKKVETASQLRNTIGLRREGNRVSLDIIRDGKKKVIKANIGKTSLLGNILKLGNNSKTKEILKGVQFSESENNDGVHIAKVEPGTKAMNSGLRAGDLIVEANREKVKNLDDLKNAIEKDDEKLLLRIERSNSALFLVIK